MLSHTIQLLLHSLPPGFGDRRDHKLTGRIPGMQLPNQRGHCHDLAERHGVYPQQRIIGTL